nr:MAG TPA: hypothetical protein [Caudoviricetes sp.]
MSKSSINMYERGEREPGLELLEVFADFFNVDMNYLMGKSSIPRQTLITTDKAEIELFQKFSDLNKIGKREVKKLVDRLHLQPKYLEKKHDTDEYDDAFPISDMVAYDMDDMIEQDPMEDFDEVSTTADR